MTRRLTLREVYRTRKEGAAHQIAEEVGIPLEAVDRWLAQQDGKARQRVNPVNMLARASTHAKAIAFYAKFGAWMKAEGPLLEQFSARRAAGE